MDDETILELITDFLRTRNLLRSSEILDEEREVFLHHNDQSRVSNNGQSLGMKPSILEQLLLEGRKSMFVNHNGVHVSSELERARDSKEESSKQQQDWNILKKSSEANTLVNEEQVVYYDDDDEVEDEQILGNGALKTKTPNDSRSASRTSSLHKRSTSMNSYLSSKSASFLGLGESDEDAATSTPPVHNFEFESDVDEWSDDDDAGFVKLSMEEFYQYGDDDFSVSHRAFRAFTPVEPPKELPTPTKKDDLASSDFSLPPIQLEYENPDDDYPDIPHNQFIEDNSEEEENYDDNSWDQPVTQDLPQDNVSEPGFEIQSPAAVPSPSMFHHTEEKNNDTSFTHEDFEVDRLSELLRGHIQISRDEYYNDPAKFWKSEDPKLQFQEVPQSPSSSSPTPIIKETEEEVEEEEEEVKNEVIFDSFNLPVIYQRGRTGLEESKDFPIVTNTVIAGRYQILEFLGAAAFSTAVKCLDLSTGQQVCVKIIKNNKEFVDQSLDEIKLLMQINHNIDPDDKCVLQLYDYFYHKEHLFIVTELLRENLYDFYRYNRESGEEFYFTIERMKRITKQLLIGLEYIHSLNLIHADLKPENILIKSYSRVLVKIIDFGSSCYTKDHLSSYVQSRSYRAPEVMLGLPYDQRIDIWSLGCILAELWTGKVLFQNESIATLLARVVGILGPFDEELLRNSRHASKYFTSNGLLYDKKEDQYIFLIPKKTSLSKRLKCDDEMFVEFVASLLTLRPEKRPTAAEALQHPFLNDVQI